VTIVGGHSIDDPEPKYGLAVTGLVDPERVVRTVAPSPGATLVLTKPLGMGIITSGIKEGKTSEATAAEAVRVMGTLNRGAAAAMAEVGVDAATDVTGFGLVGHLLEMLGGSLSAQLDFDAIPVLLEAVELASAGVLPGGSKRNMDTFGARVDAPRLDDARRAVLFDAQTSGGLLIAVDAARGDALHEALAANGVTGAATIGRLVPGSGTIAVRAG
jgi:selenide,water dikinase